MGRAKIIIGCPSHYKQLLRHTAPTTTHPVHGQITATLHVVLQITPIGSATLDSIQLNSATQSNVKKQPNPTASYQHVMTRLPIYYVQDWKDKWQIIKCMTPQTKLEHSIHWLVQTIKGLHRTMHRYWLAFVSEIMYKNINSLQLFTRLTQNACVLTTAWHMFNHPKYIDTFIKL